MSTGEMASHKVVNLCSHTLSQTEESILGQRLSFLPTKSRQNMQFGGDLETFSCCLREKGVLSKQERKHRHTAINPTHLEQHTIKYHAKSQMH